MCSSNRSEESIATLSLSISPGYSLLRGGNFENRQQLIPQYIAGRRGLYLRVSQLLQYMYVRNSAAMLCIQGRIEE